MVLKHVQFVMALGRIVINKFSMKKMKNMWRVMVILVLILTSCMNGKNEYPAAVTQNFMNSCQESSGGDVNGCACLLDKIQEKYTIEEFNIIETKMSVDETPSDFLEFIGKARAECNN